MDGQLTASTVESGPPGTIRPSLSDGCIALQLNDPNAVPTLLKQIEKNGSTFRLNDGAASSVRLDLLNAARFLVYALETPREAMVRHCWSQSTTFAAIEISVNLGLFKFLAVDDRPKTGFSKAMTTPRFGDSYPCIYPIYKTGCITAGCLALPEYFKNRGYRSPDDSRNCPFQFAFQTSLHFFEFLQANPAISSLFHNHMSTYHLGRPSWIDDGFYPIEERLIRIASSSPEDVLIVDVGGSLGHDLSEFRRKFLQAPGRLVLQDLPTMLSQVENLDTDIELMAHDFFKVQPVKSARAYYLHSILHDWNDDKCRNILTNLKDAMNPGYSKILINENVVPETNANWETTSLDIILMAESASQEHTLCQWHALIGSVGMNIVKIYSTEHDAESLIECELA
ncbi:uncharacterized protein ATNIH1004_002986 [Aspergillus tanneri]|uniref:O-methyltransferase C-terminal domain-containing protein n=1 Tax=Aspergillus tanneri TaxID=1220188 RepID=A0A5M9MZI4_9EURO|nr:uncharacterized protein ATNIH1004_002986 [Aspergillus tanneri]KAA8650303.1 hypothetical protein ATNIH1004_002986 [Aspergillus tanneri]